MTKEKIENWEKEFDKDYETDDFVDQNFYTRSDTMLSYGRDDIKSFIRQLLKSEKEKWLKNWISK